MTKFPKYRIHLSGLRPEEKTELRDMIERLRGEYDEHLTFHTRYLVCNSVDNGKHRLACNMSLMTVSPSWIRESFFAGDWQDPAAYRLGIFEGIDIGVVGFKKDEFEQVRDVIEKNKGKVVSDVDEIFSGKDKCTVIVVCPDTLAKYSSQISVSKSPVVELQWISQCVIDGRYLLPDKFLARSALDGKDLPVSKTLAPDKRMITADSLDTIMNKIEASDKFLTYLSSCAVYLFRLSPDEDKIQRKLIHIGGGFHLTSIIPSVTHVVADTFTDDDVSDFSKFSNVHIVNTNWLKECLFCKTRVVESEYMIRPFRRLNTQATPTLIGTTNRASTRPSAAPISSRPSGAGDDSSFFGTPVPNLGERKTLGVMPSKIKPESTLFQKQTSLFYFDDQVKIELKPTILSVIKNSGCTVKTLEAVRDNKVDCHRVFVVLPDGRTDIAAKARELIKEKAVIVSPRWVDYCIGRNVILKDPIREEKFHLLPFPQPTPYPCMKGVTVLVSPDISFDRRVTLIDIVNILGGTAVRDPKDPHMISIRDVGEDEECEERVRPPVWLMRIINTASIDEETQAVIAKYK